MEARKTIDAVSMNDRVLLDIEQMQARYGLGRQTLDKIADKIGAKVKIGRSSRYKRETMDDWANSLGASRPGETIDDLYAGDGELKKDCTSKSTAREDINGRTSDVCEEDH